MHSSYNHVPKITLLDYPYKNKQHSLLFLVQQLSLLANITGSSLISWLQWRRGTVECAAVVWHRVILFCIKLCDEGHEYVCLYFSTMLLQELKACVIILADGNIAFFFLWCRADIDLWKVKWIKRKSCMRRYVIVNVGTPLLSIFGLCFENELVTSDWEKYQKCVHYQLSQVFCKFTSATLRQKSQPHFFQYFHFPICVLQKGTCYCLILIIKRP